jgi:hypothetical protein
VIRWRSVCRVPCLVSNIAHLFASKKTGPGFQRLDLIRRAVYIRPCCHRGFISSWRSALSNCPPSRRAIDSAPRQCVGVLDAGPMHLSNSEGTTGPRWAPCLAVNERGRQLRRVTVSAFRLSCLAAWLVVDAGSPQPEFVSVFLGVDIITATDDMASLELTRCAGLHRFLTSILLTRVGPTSANTGAAIVRTSPPSPSRGDAR